MAPRRWHPIVGHAPAVAILLTIASASACGQTNEPTAVAQTGLADPNVRAKLRTMALQASSAKGDPSPKTIEVVASPDHQAAEKIVSGDIVYDHVAVYVVELMGGTFTETRPRPRLEYPRRPAAF